MSPLGLHRMIRGDSPILAEASLNRAPLRIGNSERVFSNPTIVGASTHVMIFLLKANEANGRRVLSPSTDATGSRKDSRLKLPTQAEGTPVYTASFNAIYYSTFPNQVKHTDPWYRYEVTSVPIFIQHRFRSLLQCHLTLPQSIPKHQSSVHSYYSERQVGHL